MARLPKVCEILLLSSLPKLRDQVCTHRNIACSGIEQVPKMVKTTRLHLCKASSNGRARFASLAYIGSSITEVTLGHAATISAKQA